MRRNYLICDCCSFLDEMSTENTRRACWGMGSASGLARALEAANSHTKKHGRRNKKSPNCKYCIWSLCSCSWIHPTSEMYMHMHMSYILAYAYIIQRLWGFCLDWYVWVYQLMHKPSSIHGRAIPWKWRSQGMLRSCDWINPGLLLSFYLEGVWLSHPHWPGESCLILICKKWRA